MTSLMRRSRGWAPGPKSCSPAPPKVTRRKDGLRSSTARTVASKAPMGARDTESPSFPGLVGLNGLAGQGAWLTLMLGRLQTTLRRNSEARLSKYCLRGCGVVDIDHMRPVLGPSDRPAPSDFPFRSRAAQNKQPRAHLDPRSGAGSSAHLVLH